MTRLSRSQAASVAVDLGGDWLQGKASLFFGERFLVIPGADSCYAGLSYNAAVVPGRSEPPYLPLLLGRAWQSSKLIRVS